MKRQIFLRRKIKANIHKIEIVGWFLQILGNLQTFYKTEKYLEIG
jgi:hypothetical protein